MVPISLIRNIPTQVVPPHTVLPFTAQLQASSPKIKDNVSQVSYPHQTLQHTYPGYVQKSQQISETTSAKSTINQQGHNNHFINHHSPAQVQYQQKIHAINQLNSAITQSHQQNQLPKEFFMLNSHTSGGHNTLQQTASSNISTYQQHQKGSNTHSLQKMTHGNHFIVQGTQPLVHNLSPTNSNQVSTGTSHQLSPTLPASVGTFPKYLSAQPRITSGAFPNYYTHRSHETALNASSYQQQLHNFALQSKILANFDSLLQHQRLAFKQPQRRSQPFSYPNYQQPGVQSITHISQSPVEINNFHQKPMQSAQYTAQLSSHSPVQTISPTHILNSQRNNGGECASNNQIRSTEVFNTGAIFRPYAIHENTHATTRKRKRDEILQPGNSPKIFASHHTLPPHQNSNFGEAYSRPIVPFIPPYQAIHLKNFSKEFYTRVLYQQMQNFQALRKPMLEITAAGIKWPEARNIVSPNIHYPTMMSETPKKHVL